MVVIDTTIVSELMRAGVRGSLQRLREGNVSHNAN